MSHRRVVAWKVNPEIDKATTIIEKNIHSSNKKNSQQQQQIPMSSFGGGGSDGISIVTNSTSVMEITDGMTLTLDNDDSNNHNDNDGSGSDEYYDNDNDTDDNNAAGQDIEPLSTSFIQNDGRERNDERHKRRLRNWKESPFAVGLTEPTWVEERSRSTRLMEDDSGCLLCSAYICPLFGAGRVGNMAVLKSSSEIVEVMVDRGDDEHGQQSQPSIRRIVRPKLDFVVGPYWPMLVCVTYPLILGVSGWAFSMGIYQSNLPIAFVLIWIICTLGLIISLACTAFRDPGILHRVRTLPPHYHVDNWRWSDQAESYRPRSAWYDSDTGVIVEGFDHTCPWTGTAIGRNNMIAFQTFVCLVFVCMILDIMILTGVLR